MKDTRDFISFTKDEMDFIFDRDNTIKQQKINIKGNQDELLLKTTIENDLQATEHDVRLRNELATCFTDSAFDDFKSDLKNENPDVNDIYWDTYLSLIKEYATNEILPAIRKFAINQKLAVVLDYNVAVEYKKKLRDFLINEGVGSVTFYTFKDLKLQRGERDRVRSNIKENYIVILSILNHNVGKGWAIYPNSFDPIPLTGNQKILQIINKPVFEPRYSWYEYRYCEQKKKILNSDFRTKYIKQAISVPSRNSIFMPEPQADEDEYRARGGENTNNKCTLSYDDNSNKRCNDNDYLLCTNEKELSVFTVADTKKIYDDLSLLKVQLLSELYSCLDLFVTEQEQETSKLELSIRQQPILNLSQDEINSGRELWKILLEREVINKGGRKVYENIMSQVKFPISYNSFLQWIDILDTSFLPRNKEMQRIVIMQYLKLDQLYLNLLRFKKTRATANTQRKNQIYDSFLSKILLVDDVAIAFNSLDDIEREYIGIQKPEELKTIVSNIKMSINFKQLKDITI